MTYHVIETKYIGKFTEDNINSDCVDVISNEIPKLINNDEWKVTHHSSHDSLEDAIKAISTIDGYAEHRKEDIIYDTDITHYRAHPGKYAPVTSEIALHYYLNWDEITKDITDSEIKNVLDQAETRANHFGYTLAKIRDALGKQIRYHMNNPTY